MVRGWYGVGVALLRGWSELEVLIIRKLCRCWKISVPIPSAEAAVFPFCMQFYRVRGVFGEGSVAACWVACGRFSAFSMVEEGVLLGSG